MKVPVLLALTALLVVLADAQPAHAYWDYGFYGTGAVAYRFDSSFLAAWPAAPVHRAELAWRHHIDMGSVFYVYNQQNDPNVRNLMRRMWVDGRYGKAANGTIGCTSNTQGFVIDFDRDDPFWGDVSNPPVNWVDLQSVATHEFGHWMGLHHSGDAAAYN